MVKKIVLCIVLFSLVGQAIPQEKHREKVKHKYQQEDRGKENLPAVFVHGRVQNLEREKLAGASIYVLGTNIFVNTNEEGEYFISGLPTGKISILISFVGYRTKIIDYIVQEGHNNVLVTLDRDKIALEPVTVISQLRNQQLLDIPSGISTVSNSMLENNNIKNMPQLSEFVPGLLIREQTPHKPDYVIRGLTGDEVSLSAQPRVAVYFNNIPTSRASMASAELYDMERVEVLKGPQGTLFSRGSEIGVVQFITRKPGSEEEGYLTAGMGDYGMKELQGALNIPVIPDKLFIRAAGIFTYRDGYVRNTFGGTLNGRNTTAARFSLRYLPFWNTRVDLVVNYQKDDLPGTAFMSKQFPNVNGITDIFQYQASLDQGKNLKNYRDILGTSLEIKRYRNENNYLSFLTSWYTNSADSRWDGDGTAAPAVDMAENIHVKQFTQEIRYNFSRKSRLNGSFGAGYWREKADQTYWFGPNEQYMAYLILQTPQYLVSSDGKIHPMTALPANSQLGTLAGTPLPSDHQEENLSGATNQAIDAFLDATWQITKRLSFTGGIRAAYEKFRVTNQTPLLEGSSSVLGILTGMYPNLLFKPVNETIISKKWKTITYRANLKYDLNINATVFAGYSRGRRPHVIQFDSKGNSEIMNQEILHSFDAGFKTAVARRIWADFTGFYYLFNDFQTNSWVNNNYLVQDAGKATSYGAETSLRIALLKNLDFFGNYTYIHTRFDSLDNRGNKQEYAGNEFRLTPRHSFTAGFNARVTVNRFLNLFLSPYYTWKSHIWFEDANTSGLEQSACGILYTTAGFSLSQPELTVSFCGSNLLKEKYIISAGNTGIIFGVPTFIPGPPRMFSGKITWKF